MCATLAHFRNNGYRMSDFSVLNLITAIIGFAVSAILFYSPERNWKTNFFLGICFAIVSYRSICVFLIQNQLVENNFLIGNVSFLFYFIPPAYYLYFKKVVYDQQSFENRDLWHLVIPVLATLLLIYYFFAGFIINGTWRLPVHNNIFEKQSPFPLYVQMGHHALAIAILSVFYLFKSWKIRLKHLRKSKDEHSQKKKIRVWIDTLLIICTTLCILLLVSVVVNWTLGYKLFKLDLKQLMLARNLVLIYLFTRVIINKDLLFGIPTIQTTLPDIDRIQSEEIKNLVPESDSNTVSESEFEYKTDAAPTSKIEQESSEEEIEKETIISTKENIMTSTAKKKPAVYFDDYGWVKKHEPQQHSENILNIEYDKVNLYIEQINQLMDKEPFVDPNFDMKYISSTLQIPHYHVEYVFRYYNKYNFNEFRNLLRVRHVLKDLQLGVYEFQTIESLGTKAGFSSRSSFFRVFKSVTGKTPKQYVEDAF